MTGGTKEVLSDVGEVINESVTLTVKEGELENPVIMTVEFVVEAPGDDNVPVTVRVGSSEVS